MAFSNTAIMFVFANVLIYLLLYRKNALVGSVMFLATPITIYNVHATNPLILIFLVASFINFISVVVR